MNSESSSTITTTTAAEVIAHHGDLLTEIIFFLPAKSLIRFKSVIKHWHSLITEASFSHLHTLRHRKPQTSFFLRASPSQFFHLSPTSKKFTPFNFNFNFNFAQAKILQSCNGLFLLDSGSPHKNYYVYNPTTGESRNLLLKGDVFWGLFLAFDPSKSPNYKVIWLRNTSYSILLFEIEVYDSETHTWKREESIHSDLPPPLRDWVYSDNCIYSLSYDCRVYCFDIEKLMFRSPPLQIFNMRHRTRRLNMFYITESGGHVHYIAHDDVINYLAVYEITENGCDWSIKQMINFDNTTAAFRAITHGKVCFLGVIRGDREEESLVYHVPGKVMVLRFYGRRFEELVDLKGHRFYEEGRLQSEYHDAYQFVESLAPI